MKRLFALLLALALLLCGCVRLPQPTDPSTEPTTESRPVEPVDQGPDFGLYNPDSTVEDLTDGAVREYTLPHEHTYAVLPVWDGLLTFSGDENTTLDFYREDEAAVSVTLSNAYLSVGSTTLRITDSGIIYYDYESNAVVTLGKDLKETSRVELTVEIPTTPVLSLDGQKIYYFDDVSLRCLDLTTGVSRLLKESTFADQEAWALHFDGTVLECFLYDMDTSETIYVSTENGETLSSVTNSPFLTTEGERYFAECWESGLCRYIFGSRGGEPQCLIPNLQDPVVYPLANRNGALFCSADDDGVTAEYYDLENGNRIGSVRLAGIEMLLGAVSDDSAVWLLAQTREDETATLYLWEPTLSPTGDTASYISPYYTSLDPDTDGLEALEKQAKELGDRYDLRIRIWEDALKIQPSDYSFELEYLTELYRRDLAVLETALSQFPEGFLKKLGRQSENGKITLSLVRSINGSNDLGSLTSADGVHFWNDGSVYIGLAMGNILEQTLYHELFHSIDSVVLTETLAYDFWDSLNPEGFEYDYDYVANQYRQDDQYLEEDTRSFIDMYSMSFPKEDRARIMEYAMLPGQEHLFVSDTMQAKLSTLCKGIREAFGLKKYAQPLPWEQYLEKPLVS